MNISDYLMIGAVVVGPILAVQVSMFLERRREASKRKLTIFKTLMTTRATRLSLAHVEALNMIDIEFYGIKEVLEAWKTYLDHLNDKSMSLAVWGSKQIDLFIELLYKMAVFLGYDYDKVQLKRTSYFPEGHGKIEDEWHLIRGKLVELLTDKYSLPLKVVSFPNKENNH